MWPLPQRSLDVTLPRRSPASGGPQRKQPGRPGRSLPSSACRGERRAHTSHVPREHHGSGRQDSGVDLKEPSHERPRCGAGDIADSQVALYVFDMRARAALRQRQRQESPGLRTPVPVLTPLPFLCLWAQPHPPGAGHSRDDKPLSDPARQWQIAFFLPAES